MAPELIVDKPEAISATLVRRVEDLAGTALRERGRFALALPGGSAAETFIPALAGAKVDWAGVDLFWGDERAVPPDHPDSNYGLARSLWLKSGGPPAARVHRMPADAPDLEAAARAYEARLVERLGTPPSLDVALLGVGPDGHICSLFPGHALLRETVHFVAPIEDSPKAPPRRLTLTLAALAAARLLVVGAFGAGKAAVMREALDDEKSNLPLALALRRAPRSLVLLDPAAAGDSSLAPGGR
jgi:6-phosphogluconolactonase